MLSVKLGYSCDVNLNDPNIFFMNSSITVVFFIGI